ncbi:Uncharacterized protein Fot_44539 [Forsythia ovata]|uniref:Uncharacterized protein n=1 Tax=Forsythia ovata TaxID=205694 RepID=A0ABD1R3T9_9LAMI
MNLNYQSIKSNSSSTFHNLYTKLTIYRIPYLHIAQTKSHNAASILRRDIRGGAADSVRDADEEPEPVRGDGGDCVPSYHFLYAPPLPPPPPRHHSLPLPHFPTPVR